MWVAPNLAFSAPLFAFTICALPVILFGLFLRPKRRPILVAMLAVVVLVVVGVGVEGVIVTERERVERMVHDVVAAIESNEPKRVLEFISPSADQTRSFATSMLQKIRVVDVKIKIRAITIDRLSTPPSAEVQLDAVVLMEHPQSGAQDPVRYVRSCTVKCMKEGKTWLVTDVTDAGLGHIKELTRLEILQLDSRRDATDAGLEHLKGLTDFQ